MSPEDRKRLRELCDSMRGRFFHDEERGDIGYIAAACDAKECDCELKLNSDGDQDCSYSIADVESSDVDSIGPVLVEMLNALRPLLDQLEAMERALPSDHGIAPSKPSSAEREARARDDHFFEGDDCDCELCGEGYMHYLHAPDHKRDELSKEGGMEP